MNSSTCGSMVMSMRGLRKTSSTGLKMSQSTMRVQGMMRTVTTVSAPKRDRTISVNAEAALKLMIKTVLRINSMKSNSS